MRAGAAMRPLEESKASSAWSCLRALYPLLVLFSVARPILVAEESRRGVKKDNIRARQQTNIPYMD